MSIITCSHKQDNLYVLLLSAKWQNWSVYKFKVKEKAQAEYTVTVSNKVTYVPIEV